MMKKSNETQWQEIAYFFKDILKVCLGVVKGACPMYSRAHYSTEGPVNLDHESWIGAEPHVLLDHVRYPPGRQHGAVYRSQKSNQLHEQQACVKLSD